LIDDDDGGVEMLEHMVTSRWVTALPGLLAWGFAVG
jgi:hypothetical protein